MSEKQATARIKINTLLQAAGWRFFPEGDQLANIDFVDAALCTLTAERFLLGRTNSFGDQEEGFIVVPT